MTTVPADQPLSRRERRLLEQQGSTFESALAKTGIDDSAGLEPDFSSPGDTGTDAPAVTPEVPPRAESLRPRREQRVAEVPLSRRERRAMEQAGSLEPQFSETQQLSTAPISTPPPPEAPLPPVFAAPSSASTGAWAASAALGSVSPSRVVGDIATATSSLIIPTTPTIDIAGPLGDTGEVVVTGQIRLPSGMSERGTNPHTRSEDRDDDEVMDEYVTGAIPASAKPMRASQAVSGKGDDSDIVLVRRARWGTAAVVAALGAGVLGLAAVALLVLALMTDVVG